MAGSGYAGLADAFAGEVAARLPALLAAVTRLPDAVAEATTHAHTLASSAAILGEAEASRAARACEELLLPYATGPLPAAVASDAAALAETVALVLAPWLLRGAA